MGRPMLSRRLPANDDDDFLLVKYYIIRPKFFWKKDTKRLSQSRTLNNIQDQKGKWISKNTSVSLSQEEMSYERVPACVCKCV